MFVIVLLVSDVLGGRVFLFVRFQLAWVVALGAVVMVVLVLWLLLLLLLLLMLLLFLLLVCVVCVHVQTMIFAVSPAYGLVSGHVHRCQNTHTRQHMVRLVLSAKPLVARLKMLQVAAQA